MDASVVILAIQAGVRLGRKLNDVLVDKTYGRPLILPMGNLYGNVVENDALDYFREHPELTSGTGPYAGLSPEEKVDAYRTILALEDRLGDRGGMAGDAQQIAETIKRVLALSTGALENRINSANFPLLGKRLLVSALWSELDLQDDAAVATAALRILRETA